MSNLEESGGDHRSPFGQEVAPSELRRDEPMSRHASWKAGGPADRFFAPADLEDLSMFLGQLPPEPAA